MTSESTRSLIVLIALVATLAMAPVAPEAGNIMFLVAGGAALLLLREEDRRMIARPALWMPLAGFACLALAYCLAGGIDGLLGLVFVAPLAAMMPLIVAGRHVKLSAGLVAVLALCGAAGTAAMAVAEFTDTGTIRAGEGVANPIHFADMALSVGFLALTGVLFWRSPVRWLFLLGPVLAAVAVLLSGTRGALVALAAMTGTAIIVGLLVRLVSVRQFAIGAVGITVLVAVAGLAGAGQTSTVQRMMADIADLFEVGSLTDSSISLRLQMYQGGLAAFLESPLVGHGPFDFVEAAASRASAAFAGTPHLHSDMLDFAASGGVLGLCAYFLFLLAPVAEAVRTVDPQTRKRLVLISATLGAGFFTMGLTNAMFGILNLTVFYGAVTLVIASLSGPPETSE